jgi:hypothetical protein
MDVVYGRVRHDENEGIRFGKLFAELYYYMGKNILEAMGEEKGSGVIEKAIREFANMRIHGMKEETEEKGIVIKSLEDFFQIRDMPDCGWKNGDERGIVKNCLFDETWKRYGELGKKLESLYCPIDYQLYSAFGFHLERPKCKCNNDDICQFILTRED